MSIIADRNLVSSVTGFDFAKGELQTVNESDLLRLVQAVRDIVLPVGFKVVPVEPTKEMLFACEDAGSIHNHQRGKRIYKAMLDAAPVLGVNP